MNSFLRKIGAFLDKYSILVAGVVIYGYYLVTSLDLLKTVGQKHGFLDYVLQFDSLILLWILAAVVIQLQRYRKGKTEEDDYRRKIELEFEKQKIHLQLLDEITTLLQDHANNPLSMISTTSNNIRKQFQTDDEILLWVDRIESSLHRIHSTIKDIKTYKDQQTDQTERAGQKKQLAG